MEAKNEEVVAHLLSDVVEFARGRLPEATFRIVEPFLRHYYDFVDADDLQDRSIADLYGAAMAHWQTARNSCPAASGCACTTRSSSSTAGTRTTR